MPTTRHGYDTSFYVSGDQGLITHPVPVESGVWEPTVSETENPIEFGTEVFAHKRMPDGTPLDIGDRRYIAAVIMNSLRKGE